MSPTYTPIELVKSNTDNGFDMIKQFLTNHNVESVDDLTVNDVIDALVDDYHKTKIYDIKNFLYNVFLVSMKAQDKNFVSNVESKNSSILTEFKDVFLFPLLLDEWSKSKQVFKPDSDFADALLHTDKLCISKEMILHLPYNLFYIDTSNCVSFNLIDGIFVYIRNFADCATFCLYAVTNNLTYYSFYLTAGYNEQNCLNIDFNEFGTAKYDAYIPAICRIKSVQDDVRTLTYSNEDIQISRSEIYAFAMQMIAYLSIDEPQLTESDLTKNTYRAPSKCSKVRNKWSEVRIQDVGVKYGNNFRKTYVSKIIENNNQSGKRKSPIPHFRCAHWHKFWIGEGRKKLVVKWIEPIFVGNGENKNVIIHKVKKE